MISFKSYMILFLKIVSKHTLYLADGQAVMETGLSK